MIIRFFKIVTESTGLPISYRVSLSIQQNYL